MDSKEFSAFLQIGKRSKMWRNNYVNFVVENDIPGVISKEELREAIRNDKELHKIILTVHPEEEGRPQGYGCETLYLCFWRVIRE